MGFRSSSVCPPASSDADGAGALYEHHAEFVWRVLQRFGVHPSELEDALQEVFLVVHRRLGDYDPARAKLTTWLFGIAARVATAFRRRHGHRPQLSVESMQPIAVALVDPEQTQRLQAVQTALGTLAPDLSATLLLYEVDQMSCAQIAELSGVPVGTVYSRLHLARKRLRRSLSRQGQRCFEEKL